MGSWTNSDGLRVNLGVTEATRGIAGEYNLAGRHHIVDIKLDLTTLGTSAAIIEDNVFWPVGGRIEKIEVVNITAATGTGAVLNLGIKQNADRSTEIDHDGFIAALPLASMDAVGETTVLTAGVTYGGALLGVTNPTYVGILCADYDTAAFTAGVVSIRLFWSVP